MLKLAHWKAQGWLQAEVIEQPANVAVGSWFSHNQGHQRTFHDVRVASALSPKADIRQRNCALGQERTHAPQQFALLFDYFVGSS
jgi:hypothetical protein